MRWYQMYTVSQQKVCEKSRVNKSIQKYYRGGSPSSSGGFQFCGNRKTRGSLWFSYIFKIFRILGIYREKWTTKNAYGAEMATMKTPSNRLDQFTRSESKHATCNSQQRASSTKLHPLIHNSNRMAQLRGNIVCIRRQFFTWDPREVFFVIIQGQRPSKGGRSDVFTGRSVGVNLSVDSQSVENKNQIPFLI